MGYEKRKDWEPPHGIATFVSVEDSAPMAFSYSGSSKYQRPFREDVGAWEGVSKAFCNVALSLGIGSVWESVAPRCRGGGALNSSQSTVVCSKAYQMEWCRIKSPAK